MVCIGCNSNKKFHCDFVAQTFALIAPVRPILHRVQCGNETIPNAPKHYEMQQNISFVSLGVYRVRQCRKDTTRVRGTIFCINCTRLDCLHRVQCSNKTVPNAPKHYEMQQNKSVGSHGVFLVCSQLKVPMRLRGMNFCVNCTCSAHFAPCLVQQPNGPKCTQTLRNTLKHEFRVQWCRSSAFVVTSLDATSRYKLLV